MQIFPTSPDYRQLFFRVLWITTLVKLVFAFWLPVTGDEAYFIVWGKNPDYGFYDHTPMVGWWLTALLSVSDNIGWLRLPSVMISTFIGWVIYRFTQRHSSEAAFFAAAMFLVAPVDILGVLITTDTPLIFWSFLSAYSFYQAQKNDHFGWYLLSGVLLGLAFFSKFFAGLLGIAYFVYLVLFVRRGWRPYAGLLLVIAGTLPFIALNLLWNYNHCWDNYLFNLVNRTQSATFSLGTFGKYLLVMVYLVTPPIIYYLLRDYQRIRLAFKDTERCVYLALFLIPIGLFLLLSFWKVIGLHWLLSFYPFMFIALAYVFTRQQWLRSFYFMTAFSAVHVIGLAVVVALSPGLFKGKDIYNDVVYGFHAKEIYQKIEPMLDEYELATNSYVDSALLEYVAKRPVMVFGYGSYHARQDDMLTDFRELDGKNILMLRFSHPKKKFDQYFDSLEVEPLEVAGGRFYLVKAKGFRYQLYREQMLEKIMHDFYSIPAYLPGGSCYMFEKYGRPAIEK